MESFEPILANDISPLDGSRSLGITDSDLIANPLVRNTQHAGAMGSGFEELANLPPLEVTNFDPTLESSPLLDTIKSDIQAIALNSDSLVGDDPELQFESGVFTVGDSGEISIDFLFDGGKWQGELAMFSLSGMDEFEVGSTDFIKEAARRALTDSELGRVVIADKTEGAKFSGILGNHEKKDWNSGEYQGVKTFAMNSGDELGFMLTPKGSIQKILDKPKLSNSQRPWFSMMTGSGNTDNFGRLVDITGNGNAFAFGDGYGDGDYNDFIFQVKGVSGDLDNLNSRIDLDADWRTTDLGIALQNYANFEPTSSPPIQVSDIVGYALERAANLEQYDPEALAATREWVVGVSETQSADNLALLLGIENLGETGIIDNTHIFKFSERETPQEVAQRLQSLSGLEFAYPLVAQQRPHRAIPNDTFYQQQWHLNNSGQTGGTIGSDANLEDAWDFALGDGVVIGVVDDGLQHTHPDLNPQYRSDLSFDFVNNDSDPSPNLAFNHAHGTAVAGIAAALGNNGLGVSGAAPNASLAGLRLTAGATPDKLEALALSHARQEIDIYNNSWGPPDVGTLGNIGSLALKTLKTGINQGRGGLGSIYVWAAGNGLTASDNVNYDGYANSRYTIAVSAIDHNGVQSWYSEPGAPILVAAYSSGDIVGTTTTDLLGNDGKFSGDYRNDFSGTSSAAPLVSGVVALMLDANPNLTWRDVQHILANTASQNDPTDSDWVTNGAGHLVNHKYGFGAVDATAAVSAALSWTNVAPETMTSGFAQVDRNIPDNRATGLSSTIAIADNLDVEWAEVVFDAKHSFRGDLEITLVSPDGTESILAEKRNDSGDNYQNWVFTSARHWGESSLGDWTLKVKDHTGGNVGNWNSWGLKLYGTEPTKPLPVIDVTVPDSRASESGDLGWFTLSRTGDTSEALDINYSLSGRAENGIDYQQLSGTATIIPGATSAVVTVNPIDDLIGEGNEPVTLSLETGTGYQLGTGVSGTVTIVDNEPPPPIDLSGSDFNVVREPLNAGNPLNINFQVQNTEPGAAGSFDVDFYLSTNRTITTVDRFLGSYTVDGLAGNSKTDLLNIQSLTLPERGDSFWNAWGDGSYYIGAIIDSDNLIGEIDNSNNASTGEFLDYDRVQINNTKLVDLSSSYFNVDPEPSRAGDRVDVDFRIDNTEINSSGSFDVDFYISTNSTISTSDRRLGSYRVNNVRGNSNTGRLKTSLSLPKKWDSFWQSKKDGTYYIGAIVDADKEVKETREYNNRNTGKLDDYDDVRINNTYGGWANVRVNRVKGKFDGGAFSSGSDFYTRISIDGQEWRSPTKGGKNDYRPPNWSFSKFVTNPMVPIDIQLWDSDGGFRGKDDRVDIDPNPAKGYKDLNLWYNLATGQITGDRFGRQGNQIYSTGGKGEIWLTVNQF